MNANKLAAEAVSMVAPVKASGMTVNVRGNIIAVQLVRDCVDAKSFSIYNETIARVWDALTALRSQGCKFNKHNAGGVNVGRHGKELYMTSFEVVA